MTPIAVGLTVVHDETAIPKLARDTKGQALAGNISGIHDAVMAQMSPSRGDRVTGQLVVYDFTPWPSQHIDRIGT